ncbi:PAPOLA isoform 19, partial [Pan troglodytes]
NVAVVALGRHVRTKGKEEKRLKRRERCGRGVGPRAEAGPPLPPASVDHAQGGSGGGCGGEVTGRCRRRRRCR